jgi:NADH-dependent peroxiredoxin subunit F
VLESVRATSVQADGLEGPYTVVDEKGAEHHATTLLIATGAHRRKLTAQHADTFEHKGLTYCASCDGPMFSGMDVAVIGGGNAGFESAAQLLAYTKSVTLLQNSDTFKAEPVTVEKVLAHEHMRAITNAETLEVLGHDGGMVSGLRYKDTHTSEEHTLSVQGIFVEIGMIANTDMVRNLVECNDYGKIVIDPRRQRTSRSGVWAAGDCTDVLYSQNNIAAGDAVKAIEDIYAFLRA